MENDIDSGRQRTGEDRIAVWKMFILSMYYYAYALDLWTISLTREKREKERERERESSKLTSGSKSLRSVLLDSGSSGESESGACAFALLISDNVNLAGLNLKV